jgi:uncharacterized membrane protein
MYAKVKIAGHPLHPMLVGFPVALYTTAFGCFLAYALGAPALWFQIGVYANFGGVIMAAIAALPGFVDWMFGVPSGTPAKATGLMHMAANVSALIFFGLNLAMQWEHRLEHLPLAGMAVVLTGVGVVLTVVAGFFGWKMVQTHHVGVDLTPEQERYEPRAPARHPEQTHQGQRV